MMREITLAESIGKSIADIGATYSDVMILTFTDDTFVVLGARKHYHDEPPSVEQVKYEPFDIDQQEQFRLGILTPEEMDSLTKQRDQERAKACERSDLRRLAELKAKYEGK